MLYFDGLEADESAAREKLSPLKKKRSSPKWNNLSLFIQYMWLGPHRYGLVRVHGFHFRHPHPSLEHAACALGRICKQPAAIGHTGLKADGAWSDAAYSIYAAGIDIVSAFAEASGNANDRMTVLLGSKSNPPQEFCRTTSENPCVLRR